ncbi:unnamed protein product [Prorocentrum cordatum]|uniref:Uncharacterized protein n=1 Tax=Prorocentrum cordatum TaxID=2364126 RepID=A0ABN9Y9F9_9DINO|nr:unnamed protein product [Polarella glacialis]
MARAASPRFRRCATLGGQGRAGRPHFSFSPRGESGRRGSEGGAPTAVLHAARALRSPPRWNRGGSGNPRPPASGCVARSAELQRVVLQRQPADASCTRRLVCRWRWLPRMTCRFLRGPSEPGAHEGSGAAAGALLVLFLLLLLLFLLLLLLLLLLFLLMLLPRDPVSRRQHREKPRPQPWTPSCCGILERDQYALTCAGCFLQSPAWSN